MKAIEAAALAWAEHERNGFCMSADGKRRLTIAIRAYLTALAEDDSAVERIQRAINNSGNQWADEARAAIRAMGGE